MRWCIAQANRDRHGLSLLEVLVTLSMLVALTTVSISWMNTVLARQREAMMIGRWDRAASAVLDQIARDLMQKDVNIEGGSAAEPRVWIQDERLCIRSQGRDSNTTIRYMLVRERQDLVRQYLVEDTVSLRNPPMLGWVDRVEFILSLPDESRILPELRVVLRSSSGRMLEGFFLLEPGDTAS